MKTDTKTEKSELQKLADNAFNLKNPIKRGETSITTLTVKEPNAGSLRGVSLASLAALEVDVIIKLAPRILSPLITQEEANALCLTDIMSYGNKLAQIMSPTMGNDITPQQ